MLCIRNDGCLWNIVDDYLKLSTLTRIPPAQMWIGSFATVTIDSCHRCLRFAMSKSTTTYSRRFLKWILTSRFDKGKKRKKIQRLSKVTVGLLSRIRFPQGSIWSPLSIRKCYFFQSWNAVMFLMILEAILVPFREPFSTTFSLKAVPVAKQVT